MPPAPQKQQGTIASLHLHPVKSGMPFTHVDRFQLVAAKGILGNPRYFARGSRRQVTLIEREQIADHAAAFDLKEIAPGTVRSNIETEGINLVHLVGKKVRLGSAIVHLYAPRDPCEKMDRIQPGLRERMLNDRQGVLAEIVQSGEVKIGDVIEPLELENL